MPPKKRKSPTTLAVPLPQPKRARSTSSTPAASSHTASSDPLRRPHPFAQESEKHGIVLRRFYPPEMSNVRAHAYNAGDLPRPSELLSAALADTATARNDVGTGAAVVHWFKNDLRTRDNHALCLAALKAADANVPLICMYLISPQDFEAHLTSPVRVDFTLRTLAVLRADLAKLDIPLHVETVERRRHIPERIAELMAEWGANHLYANAEYEVDELRREAAMVRDMADNATAFTVVHDTCVVPPGSLRSGSGGQYAVYSPWYRAWMRHVHENLDLLDLFDAPSKNPASARQDFAHLFDKQAGGGEGLVAPKNKQLTGSDKEIAALRENWPAGEAEATRRLDKFCEERVGKYHDARNIPASDSTSSISAYLACGAISARTCVRTARDRNKTKKLDGGVEGIKVWISEVAWRDFYKHVLVNWPYVCMNKPYKPEYANIEWSYDQDHFKAWCEGRTGYPIVDAAMRQMRALGWMHNRCRMIVACFFAKDLLLDWRMGERFFMESLIDGDFASNNGGWGFSASVGVDPQPYFRIFNPLLQSEKFDPDGTYIRRWVPELAGISGPAIHDPYGRKEGRRAEKAGYPPMIVDHKHCRERALAAYKEGIGRSEEDLY